jgi:hypothetical protein
LPAHPLSKQLNYCGLTDEMMEGNLSVF